MGKLSKFQKVLVNECIAKKRGCLAIPMGSGKTLISLALSTRIGGPKGRNATLVIISKNLIGSWKTEIHKFFGNKLNYEIYHHCALTMKRMKSFRPTANLILTTPDMLSKHYKDLQISNFFQTQELEDRNGLFPVTVNRYHIPKDRPFLRRDDPRPGSFLYSTVWKCIVIDEVQLYTTASSKRCQAISSIFSRYRWALSGTPFNEPSPDRLLGYHLIIGDASFPNSIPDAEQFLKNDFTGFNSTLIKRTLEDVDFSLPPVTEVIIQHELTENEQMVYNSLTKISLEMKNQVTRMKQLGLVTLTRKFSGYILEMITYIRQFLVCPLIPFATMVIAMMNTTSTAENNLLVDTFKKELKELDLAWLSDENASLSSRIKAVVNVAQTEISEKLIVFTSFRTNLNVLMHYFPKDRRPHFTITSNHTPSQRDEILAQFEQSANGILFLTYTLGAEGLNLQHSHIVLVVDVWWNSGKIEQAIARVLRRGQMEPVKVYFFTSGTGIEKGLFTKHTDKIRSLKELAIGPTKTKVRTFTQNQFLALISVSENTMLLEESRNERL